jgi:putative ABC transport system permease protein
VDGGRFRTAILLGVDDSSLAGAPAQMLASSVDDLRRPNAMRIDRFGHEHLWPGEPYRPGRVLSLNERRLELVGVCNTSRPFVAQPVVYLRGSLARECLALPRDGISFVIPRVKSGWAPEEVCRAVEAHTGQLALTPQGFMGKTADYMQVYSGITPNFALTVALAFVVGAAISGQLFHLFVLENRRHFGALMAMGLREGTMVKIVLLQVAVVFGQGLCLGLGLSALFFSLTSGTTSLAGLYLYWQAAAVTAAAVLVFMAAVGVSAVRRILRLEPAAIFSR